MEDIPRATVRQLASKIRGHGPALALVPRFAFFLGAGASRQSGIITADEMIRFFKQQIINECCPEPLDTAEAQDSWLKSQDWYANDGHEYSRLFAAYEPKERGRQRYIESLIEGKTPSFGYAMLASLMASNYIRTVITTNFDDLVYSACTAYTDIRPIVYAYGVLASEMRITADRPKILKLHGDYLYSALKNTTGETAVQDPNMARQVSQVLNEYGLIVVGYGGGDESVMRVLGDISETNDLYWCILRGTVPSVAVQDLLRKKGGVVVPIDGFDEMMNEIRTVFGLQVGVMLGSLAERQREISEQLKGFSRQYKGILKELVDALKAQATTQADQIKEVETLEQLVRAEAAADKRQFTEAEALYRRVIEMSPEDLEAHYGLIAIVERKAAGRKEAADLARRAIEISERRWGFVPQRWFYAVLMHLLARLGDYDGVERVYKEAIADHDPPASLHADFGEACLRVHRYDTAIEAFRRAIDMEKDNAEIHKGLGWTFLLQRKLAEAEAEFETAITLAPEAHAPVFNLGLIRAMQGRDREARSLWVRGLELSKGDDVPTRLTAALYTAVVKGMEEPSSLLQDIIVKYNPSTIEREPAWADAKILAQLPHAPRGMNEAIALLASEPAV